MINRTELESEALRPTLEWFDAHCPSACADNALHNHLRDAAEGDRRHLLRDLLKLAQVRIFMVDGSENPAYAAITAYLDAHS